MSIDRSKLLYSLLPTLLIWLAWPEYAAGQSKANNNWFFGANVGLSFADGTAVQIASPALSTFEGAAAYSNPLTGELLMYTDGVRIWNARHQLMSNGRELRGNGSSTQSALIMPRTCNTFYVFTVDAGSYASEDDWGVNYSIVDMNLDNGFGDVTDVKNVLLQAPTAEKLTAAIHANGRDFWIIAHGINNNTFYAWKVDSEGIDDPVVSKVGVNIGAEGFSTIGALKASHDGRRLAMATYNTNVVEIFDFDNASGVISNPGRLRSIVLAYGLEFSPDNSKLYVGSALAAGINFKLAQFDLTAGSIEDIRNSVYSLSRVRSQIGGLQLGPDGKIYVVLSDAFDMGVIHQPDRAGAGADFVERQLRFSGGARNRLGIVNQYTGPPIIPEERPVEQVIASSDTIICPGVQVRLNAAGPEGRYVWSPAEGLDDSLQRAPLARPLQSTRYRVRYVTLCGTTEDSLDVTLLPVPQLELDASVFVCRGDSVLLEAQTTDADGVEFEWSPPVGLSDPSSTATWLLAERSQTYLLRATNEFGCSTERRIRVSVRDNANFDLGPDTVICAGMSVRLRAGGARRYEWQPTEGLSDSQSAEPLARPAATTTYHVWAYHPNGCVFHDSIRIIVGEDAALTIGSDTSICRGSSLRLPLEGPPGTYRWEPATGLDDRTAKNPLASPDKTTTYTVHFKTACSQAQAAITVAVRDAPAITVAADQRLCPGESVRLRAEGGSDYRWSPAEGLDDPTSAAPLASPVRSTLYRVLVTDERGCQAEGQVMVELLDRPQLRVGKEENICAGESAVLRAEGGIRYEWSPAEGLSATDISNPIAAPAHSTLYRVRAWNEEGCVSSATVRVNVIDTSAVRISSGGSICIGESLQLQVQGGRAYRWEPAESLSDPTSAAPTATPRTSTVYTVRIDLGDCTVSRQISVVVLPRPDVSAGVDRTICQGESTELRASGGLRYEWRPAAGLDDPQSPRPIASPRATQVYTLTAFGPEGCTAQDEVTVTVRAAPRLSGLRDTSICRGEGLQLQARGEGRIRWQPARDLSDPDSPAPYVSPSASTIYRATLTDNNGCSSSATMRVSLQPDIHIWLETENLLGGAQPGEVVPLILHIDRDAAGQPWDPGSFSLSLSYDHRRAVYMPDVAIIDGFAGWTVSATESCPGSDLLTIVGSGPTRPASLGGQLRLALMVLYFPADYPTIPIAIRDASFGDGANCLRLEGGELPLDEICLQDHRGFGLSGFGYYLSNAGPNPAEGSTRIRFGIGLEAPTTLRLYNHLGVLVALLLDEKLPPGRYEREIPTAELAAGSYFFLLRSGPYTAQRTLTVRH